MVFNNSNNAPEIICGIWNYIKFCITVFKITTIHNSNNSADGLTNICWNEHIFICFSFIWLVFVIIIYIFFNFSLKIVCWWCVVLNIVVLNSNMWKFSITKTNRSTSNAIVVSVDILPVSNWKPCVMNICCFPNISNQSASNLCADCKFPTCFNFLDLCINDCRQVYIWCIVYIFCINCPSNAACNWNCWIKSNTLCWKSWNWWLDKICFFIGSAFVDCILIYFTCFFVINIGGVRWNVWRYAVEFTCASNRSDNTADNVAPLNECNLLTLCNFSRNINYFWIFNISCKCPNIIYAWSRYLFYG